MKVINGFINPKFLGPWVDNWPIDGWSTKKTKLTYKRTISDPKLMGAGIDVVLWKMIFAADFFAKLFNIPGLVCDPSFMGAGLHDIPPGGFLKIHKDFNYHPKLKMVRRVNALLFLNKDWKDEWGGHFEWWPDGVFAEKVAPVFNRLVAFETTDTSYHGHPEPHTAPYSRKSLAFYYYAPGEVEHIWSTKYLEIA